MAHMTRGHIPGQTEALLEIGNLVSVGDAIAWKLPGPNRPNVGIAWSKTLSRKRYAFNCFHACGIILVP